MCSGPRRASGVSRGPLGGGVSTCDRQGSTIVVVDLWARRTDDAAVRARPVGEWRPGGVASPGSVRRVVGVVLAAAVGMVCQACGPADGESRSAQVVGPASLASPLPADVLAGLGVSVAQARLDRERRVVQVRVANESGVDVTVTEARLVTPGAAGTAVSARGRQVRSGVDRDLSVALGEPRCDGSTDSTDSTGSADSAVGEPRVELDVMADDGRTGSWRGTPDDPNGVLTRIEREDCAALAVASGARLTLDPDVDVTEPVDGGRPTGSVTLRFEPVAGGPRVEVLAVDGTTLLTPSGGAASWPLTLDSDDGPGVVVLAFEPARCDAHAVAEDKRGTFLGVRARVDGVAQEVVYLTPGDELRGAIRRYIGVACGWPQP